MLRGDSCVSNWESLCMNHSFFLPEKDVWYIFTPFMSSCLNNPHCQKFGNFSRNYIAFSVCSYRIRFGDSLLEGQLIKFNRAALNSLKDKRIGAYPLPSTDWVALKGRVSIRFPNETELSCVLRHAGDKSHRVLTLLSGEDKVPALPLLGVAVTPRRCWGSRRSFSGLGLTPASSFLACMRIPGHEVQSWDHGPWARHDRGHGSCL